MEALFVQRLAPRGKRPALCEGIDRKAAESLAYKAANLRFQATRIGHHLWRWRRVCGCPH